MATAPSATLTFCSINAAKAQTNTQHSSTRMMLRVFLLVCVLVGAVCALSCSWMEHHFTQYRDSSLDLLSTLANNSTNSTDELENAVAFPNELYNHVSKALAEERLSFVAQLLDEIVALFQKYQTSVSWDEKVEDFLNVMTQQADGLRSCVPSQSHKKKNKKLSLYFKRLSHHILEQTGHSADGWELIRRKVRLHLHRADMLVSAAH